MKPQGEEPDTTVADVDEDAITLVFDPTAVFEAEPPTIVCEPPTFLTPEERLSEIAARAYERAEGRSRG